MTGLLVTASAVLITVAGAAYVREALREARPQVASWVAWTALTAVTGVSALSAGQVPAGVLALADAAACAAVPLLVFRRGTWEMARLDWACLAGAGAGLVLLTAARSPALATALTVAVDAAAFIPTFRHACARPREEPWVPFAGFAAAGLLALAAAGHGGFTAVGYPAYMLLANAGCAVLVIARRRVLRPESTPAAG